MLICNDLIMAAIPLVLESTKRGASTGSCVCVVDAASCSQHQRWCLLVVWCRAADGGFLHVVALCWLVHQLSCKCFCRYDIRITSSPTPHIAQHSKIQTKSGSANTSSNHTHMSISSYVTLDSYFSPRRSHFIATITMQKTRNVQCNILAFTHDTILTRLGVGVPTRTLSMQQLHTAYV